MKKDIEKGDACFWDSCVYI